MRPLVLLAAALVVAGLAVMAYAASLGQASVAFVLFFPVLFGSGPWGFLGGLLLMAGVLLGFVAFSRGLVRGTFPHVDHGDALSDRSRTERWPPEEAAPARPRARVHGGGFLLLGPIPIAFGSTKALALSMLLLALLVLVFVVFLPLLLRGPG